MNLANIRIELDKQYKAFEKLFSRGIIDIKRSTPGLDKKIIYCYSEKTPIEIFIQNCDKISYIIRNDTDREYLTKIDLIELLEQEENDNHTHLFFNGFIRVKFTFHEKFKVGDENYIVNLSSWWGDNPFDIGIKNFEQQKEKLLENSKNQSLKIKEKIYKIIDIIQKICYQYNDFKKKIYLK